MRRATRDVIESDIARVTVAPSGERRRAAWSEVDRIEISTIQRDLLPRLSVSGSGGAGCRVPVPGFPWWEIVQIEAQPGAALFGLGARGGPVVVRFGVGWGLGAPALWWRLCVGDLPLGEDIDPDVEPERPWCGVRIEAAAASMAGVGEALKWAADRAVFVAWALIMDRVSECVFDPGSERRAARPGPAFMAALRPVLPDPTARLEAELEDLPGDAAAVWGEVLVCTDRETVNAGKARKLLERAVVGRGLYQFVAAGLHSSETARKAKGRAAARRMLVQEAARGRRSVAKHWRRHLPALEGALIHALCHPEPFPARTGGDPAAV